MGLMWVSDLEPHGLYLSCCFAMSTQVLMMHRALLFIFLGQDSWVGILGLENPPLIGGVSQLDCFGSLAGPSQALCASASTRRSLTQSYVCYYA